MPIDRRFPLVGDDEPIVLAVRPMQLYDNEDLITNIKGYYQEKVYADRGDMTSAVAPSPVSTPLASPVFEPAEKARQEARADVKKKRQAMVTREKPIVPKTTEPVSQKVTTASVQGGRSWGYYAQKLRQDSYILAELPKVYQEPQNPSAKTVKKNNYDFLKRSQIYNQDANKRNKERRVAQELNLSRFEDIN